MSVAENLRSIEARIAEACKSAGRARSEVRLIAVSKKQPPDRIAAAAAAGHSLFGENYVQELEEHRALAPHAEWHLIGHLQTNKAKKAAELAAMIHTLDSQKLVQALAKAAAGRPSKLEVLIEVNLGGEETKAGCRPDDVEALVRAIAAAPSLEASGLMCIPPVDQPSRPYFSRLRALRDEVSRKTGTTLPELSMGMSADFTDAILEGATLVRVGTAIFGERA